MNQLTAPCRRRGLTGALPKHVPYGETLHRDQRGIGTLLFAIGFLPFMLMFAVLVVDVGSAFALRRDLQTTAAAAALAGVQDLPENNALATAEAQANAALNTSGLTLSEVEITTEGFWTYLTVTVQKPSESLFANSLDFGGSTITATATARVRVLNETPILLATDSGCDNALDINGTDITVDGGIQAHAGISIGGNGNTFNDGTTYGEGCEITVNGSGHSFAPGPGPGPPASPPLDRTPFDEFLDDVMLCDFSWPGDVNLNNESGVWQSGGSSGGVLEPGAYCAPNGRIQLSGSNVSGTVTFVADEEIQISGSNLTLTAVHASGVLAFSAETSGAGIVLSGSGGTWTGCFFAPDSEIRMAGANDITVEGCLIGRTLDISGNNLQFIPPGGPSPAQKIFELWR